MQGTELKTVSAKAVIMATPKFITRRIVEGIPEKQSDAMQQMRYIPYAVVNLIFDKAVYRQGLRHLVPGKYFHRLHRRRLGRPQPAWLQAEIQHPELLHAAARRRAQATCSPNQARQNGGRVC